ncbi:ubiquitin ligase, putative [Trichomonas vaginalis G3]|uniref:HECT-type E3 ubiquitin transferase n=1 Tax=Trichomonas vaginalis (strain ATCC PRA-98 / G3) TaxID=412133 RepID=A2DQ34_TRIV3|nr:ubiquitin-protein transferase protein [Trichomonas vaginalis G3]EAY17461.1 ubiquitin ligase, putative [Trichomonas vaginalis G3]KAI5533566.1 ubiquitin-protein transferase protein [Trichomonas vaginalis G3]|eukprot:XP_001329596.1 ubiquitin ligase [Trichomonas vaginalis G3]
MIDTPSVESLIKGYFEQLTEGCDRIDCEQPECASSTNFHYHFRDPTEAAVRAVELTLNHPHNPCLCGHYSPLNRDKSILTKVSRFDSIVTDIIYNRASQIPDDQSLHNIKEVVSSEINISFILLSNQETLSISNISFDEDKLQDFNLVFQRGYKYFLPFYTDFNLMVKRFIKLPSTDTFSHVRGIILILLFEIYFNKDNYIDTFLPLLDHIIDLPSKSAMLFWSCLQCISTLLTRVVSLCETMLSIYVLKQSMINVVPKPIASLCNFITLLQRASDNSLHHLPNKVFSNSALSTRLNPLKELERYEFSKFSFLSFPSVLSLKFKHKVLQTAQENKQNTMAARSVINEGIMMGRTITNNLIFNVLEIRRDHLVEDAIRKIPRLRSEDLLKKLVITFKGEQGIDQGGVSREFFYLLTSQIFSPDYGMFTTINGYYWFSITPFEDYSAYMMLGTAVSLAIYNNVVLPIRFPTLLYKKILGKPITLTDIGEIDPDFMKSALDMINMRTKKEDVSELCLTFTTTIEQFGERIEIPLVQNGSNIDVTNDNLDAFIASYINWWANISIAKQYEAFLSGFMKISISKLYKLFGADELDILVSGEAVLDWAALKKNAKYIDGYTKDSQQIIWFWELFDQFSNDQKVEFLRFSTGTPRAPVEGLGEVQLTIQKTNDIQMLPVSHTCFNMFSLPAYKTKEVLSQKVLLAIEHSEGFGLV